MTKTFLFKANTKTFLYLKDQDLSLRDQDQNLSCNLKGWITLERP